MKSLINNIYREISYRVDFSQLYKILWYFSIWTDIQVLFIVFPSLGLTFSNIYELKRTLLCLCLCCVGGFYNANIYPRVLRLPYLHNREIIGLELKLLDILGHDIIMYYYYTHYILPNKSSLKLTPSFSLYILYTPFLYFLCMPYQQLYGFRFKDACLVSISTIFLYLFLISI